MSLYLYKARNKNGELEKGIIEAINQDGAAQELESRNLIVISILEEGKRLDIAKLTRGVSHVFLTDLMIFTKQFAAMVNAGLSIVESLKTLADEEKNKFFKDIILNIAASVEGGSSLSVSMEKYPKVFSQIYISMIKVGEASGKLDSILEKITEQLEKDYNLRTQIKGAMIYPSFIAITLGAVALLLVSFVIPKLIPILENTGMDLPFSTKVLIFISTAFIKFWWLIIPGIIGLMFFIFVYTRKGIGNEQWAKIKIKLPIAGKIIKNIYMARFARTFSTLVSGGINIVEALEISASTIGNIVYEKEIIKAAEAVKNGSNLADALAQNENMTKIIKKMIKVGEKTGSLDTLMEKMATFYEAEVTNSVNNLTKTLEPLLIIIMGVGVALVVSSVIMPLYDATRNIGQM